MRILNFTFIVQAAPSDLNRYNDPVGLFISEYLGISNSTHVRPGSTDFSANPPPLLLPVSVNATCYPLTQTRNLGIIRESSLALILSLHPTNFILQICFPSFPSYTISGLYHLPSVPLPHSPNYAPCLQFLPMKSIT